MSTGQKFRNFANLIVMAFEFLYSLGLLEGFG